MSDEVIGWAVRLAAEVAPDEAELVPAVTAAYLAGGAARRELFARTNAAPGGFDVTAPIVLFPHVLATVTLAGHAIWTALGGNASSVSTLLKNLGDLWDRRRAKQVPAAEPQAPGLPELNHLIDAISAELKAAGVPETDSEVLTFRIVRALIKDGAGTRAYLAAAPPENPSR
ncbi:hypothetical protein ACWEF6_40660 [Amycolatopsis sp. NPDC004772]|uniref:hypothetical protein n=1 Tax=unclassified Amycolatopsis TaxID=2618356 RepID=UPI002876B527|nr:MULTISPECIES: hypothetical protein [unclassified Amycolatopsis]MDS0137796.1 hypothetical protein [Amycolatopsis sp. 505]MDS0144291.1 hypothetical protein [Amycolatopsis sp. CM201R]